MDADNRYRERAHHTNAMSVEQVANGEERGVRVDPAKAANAVPIKSVNRDGRGAVTRWMKQGCFNVCVYACEVHTRMHAMSVQKVPTETKGG